MEVITTCWIFKYPEKKGKYLVNFECTKSKEYVVTFSLHLSTWFSLFSKDIAFMTIKVILMF